MDTISAIHARHSCRAFCRQPVPEHELTQILLAGQQAPIAQAMYSNMQLTAIHDRRLIDTFTARFQRLTANLDASPFYDAPTLVVIATNSYIAEGIGLANAGAVAQTMMLAATSLGISSVLLTSWVRVLRDQKDLIDQLLLERTLVPVAAVALGYAKNKDAQAPTPRSMTVKHVY
ncbi:MAG: nitroreductase family protein [Bacillota bacterium]|nr:nitroreductase family protein [Bacillota bacterium]